METLEEVQKRRRKRINIDHIDIEELSGSLEETIEMLENLRDNTYEEITLEADTNYDYDDGYAQLEIYGYRQETDEEVQARVDAYNKQQLQKFLNDREAAEQEKRTYLQLKEKYEKELG